MFTELLPARAFELQREFIRAMGANRDFVWWADTLITEETKELEEAMYKPEFSDENLMDILKEMADVFYVVCGFYNVMPVFAPELIDQATNDRVQHILEKAWNTVAECSKKLHIPLPVALMAFEAVHESNMSKLDDNGKPVRRDDGKILKGPNYHPPKMEQVLVVYKNIQQREAEKNRETTH